MRKFIKKTAATTLSAMGIFSMMPAAFCAQVEEQYNLVDCGENSYSDVLVAKKGQKSRDYTFPNEKVKTLIYELDLNDAIFFGQVLEKNKIVNGSIFKGYTYTGAWNREVEIKDKNPMNGCQVVFTSGDKKIIFLFDLWIDKTGDMHSYNSFATKSKIESYNKLLKDCGVKEATIPLSGEIVISDNVTNIEDAAFETCLGLKSVKIPESVTSVGESAFLFCQSLIEVTIPNSVTSIGENAFFGCQSLKNVNISNSIKSIEEGVFGGCESLVSVSIPESVTSIGKIAFCGCRSLNKVNIPNSVKTIEPGVFCGCESLTSVSIPEFVESIGEDAFLGCKSLNNINIPSSVKTIGSGAFCGCESLTAVSIPSSVENISGNAFYGCKNLNIKFNDKTYNNVDDFMRDFNDYKVNHK